MSRRTVATALLIPAVLALALTACAPGGSGSDDESGSGGGTASGEQDTACVSDTWNADLQDLAEQMLETLQAGGGPFTGVTAEGEQAVTIDEGGTLGFANNMTFKMTADMGNGLIMTVTQTHEGGVAADWAWDGDVEGSVMVFDNFDDSDYAITNAVDINGTASEQAIPVPEMAAGNVPMTVTCSGDVLTTTPQGSPYTTTWHRN